MRILRFKSANGETVFGAVDEDGVVRRIEADASGEMRVTGDVVQPQRVLLPVDPVQIIALEPQWADLAASAEEGLPVFFKGLNTLQATGAPVVLPGAAVVEAVDYGGELAVVISQPGRNIRPEDAMSHVLGFTCANDITARQRMAGDLSPVFASQLKSYDSFCPLGPCLATPDELLDGSPRRLRTFLNGQVVQEAPLGILLGRVPELIALLSEETTLLAGTVILLGTPGPTGADATPPRYLRDGDEIAVEIDGIGRLKNPVKQL